MRVMGNGAGAAKRSEGKHNYRYTKDKNAPTQRLFLSDMHLSVVAVL